MKGSEQGGIPRAITHVRVRPTILQNGRPETGGKSGNIIAIREKSKGADKGRTPISGNPLNVNDTVEVLPEGQTLRSGMNIEKSPVRDALEEILVEAQNIWETDTSKSALLQHVNDLADSVGEVDGIEILRGSDFKNDDYKCQEFTFGTLLQEAWVQPDRRLRNTFHRQTLFADNSLYEMVEEPDVGDVVLYVDSATIALEDHEILHWGVLGPDGRVVAKMGQGPIVRHGLDTVPTGYGDLLYFLRKTENNPVPKDAEAFEAYLQQVLEMVE